MISRLLQMLIFASALVFAVILIATIFRAQELKDFTASVSVYYSKQMCSCLFVTQSSFQNCEKLVKTFLPYQEIQVDDERRRVLVKALYHKSESVFISDTRGCQPLQTSEETSDK